MNNDKRIIFTRPDGGVSIIIPAPGITIERAMQDVPADASYTEVVDVESIPTDRTFRDAWKQEGKRCVEDVTKAKEIAHAKRRAVRDEEFAPLDRQATIPLFAEAAEADRQVIREKHAVIQTEIETSATPAEIKKALEKL